MAGRHGYSLAEGYFLPPLRFTSAEALILALGSDILATNFDTEYRVAAESAYRKIDAVLSTDMREQVSHLKAGLHFAATKPLDPERLPNIKINPNSLIIYHRQYILQDEERFLER